MRTVSELREPRCVILNYGKINFTELYMQRIIEKYLYQKNCFKINLEDAVL